MTRPYGNAREHLDEQIAAIGQLVERQIVAHWELGVLPRVMDQFSGTFVSGGEVSAIISGGTAPTPEGTQRLADLDAALVASADRIESRLAASREAGKPIAWDRLRRAFGLSPTEQRALAVLCAVEISQRLRALMRYLVNESTRIHADVGLLEILVYSGPSTRDLLITELAPDARLFRHRLIEPIGNRRQIEDAPWLLRSLRASRRVIELCHGLVRLDPEVAPYAELVADPPSWDGVLCEPEVKTELASLLARPGGPAVLLVGPDGSGRKALLYGAARAAGCGALRIRCPDLPHDGDELVRVARALLREAILFQAIPILDGADALVAEGDERARRLDAALAEYRGPVAATSSLRETKPLALSRGLVRIDLDPPSEAQRETLWRRSLDGSAGGLDFAKVAARYPISGGVILRAASSARALAAARGDGPVTDADVHAGLRGAFDAKLSTLGTRVTWRQRWDDLVLPDDTMEGLREFVARIKHRRRVYDEWGFARKMAKGLGLSALFAGPPGTGKTMVAGIIADELGLDLYQIDLSRIVSKYVGETEKNLAQVFDAAEAGHSILLFDEADSLFAKRGEVKSSVDRYANLEVNYLLQRIERFQGITILTTNLESSIDQAFKRRIAFKLDFPMPEEEERVKLWAAMLPAEASVDGEIDFDMLARKFEMSGGHIRNAVLRAAFLAADEGKSIGTTHLKRAGDLEYIALGKVV